MCPAGHFCPLNESTGSYNEIIECQEGFLCMPGFTGETSCPAIQNCPAGGTQKELSNGGLVLTIMAVVCCMMLCCCVSRQRKAQLAVSIKVRDSYTSPESIQLGTGLSDCTQPVNIEFKNVGLTLKSDGREILSGISGNYPPASLVALMGPSGSGKTTFMNALLGRASYANVSGQVIVNGKSGGIDDARNLVGFVPQDDIVHEDLTVFQNLYYSAMQRLPANMSQNLKKKHVQEVINVLGINHIQNMVVGSAKKRGISGGQKKRVNIGMELVAMPSIVFMDEPTSGLDGAATLELAQCLAELRNAGLTIICVIHQPRFTVFKEFTHLLLLGAGGNMVYGGRTEHVSTYLGSLGFRKPELENPADWIIDVVCGLQPRYLENGQVDDAFESPSKLFELWSENHAKSSTDPNSVFNGPAPSSEIMSKCVPLEPRVTPGFFRQTVTFTRRQWDKFNIQGFTSVCAALWIAAAMLGSIQSASTYNYRTLYRSLPGTTTVLALFCSIQSHALISGESLQAYREFKSGMNSSSYFMAKLVFDLLLTFFYSSFWIFSWYIQAAPFQSLIGTGYFWIFLGYCFYWSSFGGWIATTFSEYTTGLLILVFIPAIEMIWSGIRADDLDQQPIRDRTGVSWFMSTMSSGRWMSQGLYSSEILSLPPHLRDLESVKETLYNISVTNVGLDSEVSASDDELVWGQQEAVIALFGVGLLFRCLTWGNMILTKYSHGQTRRSQFKYLVCTWLQRCHLVCAQEADDVDEEDIAIPQVSFSSANLGTVLGVNPRWDHVRAQARIQQTDDGQNIEEKGAANETSKQSELSSQEESCPDHAVLEIEN